MGKIRKQLTEANIKNMISQNNILQQLVGIATTSFIWNDIPKTISPSFVEWRLLCGERIAFFIDEVLGALALPISGVYEKDVYGRPYDFEVYAPYGSYRRRLTTKDAVICWDTFTHIPATFQTLNEYAVRLSNIKRTIDVNVANQKTPIFVSCTQEQQLSLENAMMQRDSNMSAIWVLKDSFDIESIKVLNVQPSFVSPGCQSLYEKNWQEALTFLGIENTDSSKRERLIASEVDKAQGGIYASRQNRLLPRQECCELCNALFGWHMSVDFSSQNTAEIEEKEPDEPEVLNG